MSARRNVYPVAVYLNGLTNEDVNCRISSMKHLGEIAEALGEERTRAELLPFLVDALADDEEEVLCEFAEQISTFTEYVGGPRHCGHLVPPLELLCRVEEASVRARAVSAVCAILSLLEKSYPEGVVQFFWPLFKRLAENRWYTGRSSASGIAAPLYKFLPGDAKGVLRRMYWSLCQDQVPMVRRYATKSLGDIAHALEKNFVIPVKIPGMGPGVPSKDDTVYHYVDKLRKDEQDSVRLLTVKTCIALSKIVKGPNASYVIVPIIKALGRDKCWRVRYMLADHYAALCQGLGAAIARDELVTLFSKLCLDKEAEVRAVGAGQMSGVCSMLTKDQVIAELLPTIIRLVNDRNEHVRSSLAAVIMSISSILGKDATIKHLLDHFLALLKDDFPEVRLNIISKLSDVNSVIGAELLSGSGLMPSICDLAQDKQWRVRLSIINYIPQLAKQLGKTYFNERLRRLCVVWLSDSVYTIREAATVNVVNLTKIFGEQWAKEYIIPEALRLKEDTNYLHRMMVLFMVSGLAPYVSSAAVMEMLPTVLELANDGVPNILFNVAKTLTTLAPKVDTVTLQNTVKPVLMKLASSDDPDVLQYAQIGLEKLQK